MLGAIRGRGDAAITSSPATILASLLAPALYPGPGAQLIMQKKTSFCMENMKLVEKIHQCSVTVVVFRLQGCVNFCHNFVLVFSDDPS